MSSSGVDAVNSGPILLRTYNDNSANNSYVLGRYDIPIPSNYVLITSTNGVIVPSDNITISSITANTGNFSTINANTINTNTINFNYNIINYPGLTFNDNYLTILINGMCLSIPVYNNPTPLILSNITTILLITPPNEYQLIANTIILDCQTLIINNVQSLNMGGFTLTNNGIITNNGILNNDGEITNNGNIIINTGAGIYNGTLPFGVINNIGIIDINQGFIDNTGTILNKGGTINNDGTIINDGPFYNYDSGTINNNNTFTNNDIVYKGSSICGIGIFNGTQISPSPINGCPP
jgi:hypothetical protein